MATRSTGSASTTPPTTPPPPTELGTFISATSIGFVRPTPTESRRILDAMRRLPEGAVTESFLRDLLVIKQLAPAESRELLIYPAPMVVQFVKQLRNQLQLKYYQTEWR